MAANPSPNLTAAEYLALERAATFRSEFVNGEMFAMSGGLYPHGQLISRFSRELEDALEDRPCTVTVSDVRLQVAADATYVYPNVMVVCGGPAFADGHCDMITNPSLVVEVLSPSTEAWDRGGKFAQYRTLASLHEYVLVSPDALRVEWFTREANGSWAYRAAEGPPGICRLERLGVDLPLARIYRKVEGLGAV
jgi:Uma2 family endonuclease